jgi:uncharacterized membrane protein YdbT with pleckstrin-like domain
MTIRKRDAMGEPQLTLKDWETLYNMVANSQRREKELEAKIAQLEAQLSQVQASIPKTGLLSHSMLTRMVTVFLYVLVSSLLIQAWQWSLIVVGAIIVVVVIVKVIVKLTGYAVDSSEISDMAMRYNGMKR